jgi:aldose 1-epimerase
MGEEGYSGEVKVTVVYTFTNDNELVIEYMGINKQKKLSSISQVTASSH